MKILLIQFLASISIGFGLFNYRELPGCEKSKAPPNTFMEQCCPSLPRYNNRELFVTCNQTCAKWLHNPKGEGSKKCCLLNCTYVFEGVMEKYGVFQNGRMKEIMKKYVKTNNNFWKDAIDKVVDGCFKLGIDLPIAEVHNIPAQCETDNITIALNVTHCIRREMFFSCQEESMKLPRCKSLVEFGKGCNYWPWQCNHKRNHSGNFKLTSRPPGTK